ncbi:MAG: caspase family protein, partial [Pseudanabaena sp.]
MARYGLVVGVASYKKPLGNLSKTEGDAKAVNDLLKQHGDFADIQVLMGEVTAEQLDDALKRLMKQADKSEALIYFSGHAVVVKRTSNKVRGYLALSDTILKIKNGDLIGIENGYELEDLSSLCGEANLSNLVILLDSCHSEILLEESHGFLQREIAEDTFKGMPKDYFLVSACRKFEEAYAMKSESYSIFTGAMLRGLARERANERGIVYTGTMFDYVFEQLRGTGQEAVSFGYGRALRIVDYRAVVAKSEVDETCPYVGLNAFDEKTAKWFFGRDEALNRLREKLGQRAFVFVVGVSGSGKSSLVRAKLMPEYKDRGYQVFVMKPRTSPLGQLKTVLTEKLNDADQDQIEAIEDFLDDGDLLAAVELMPQKPILLVIDQFEEVFTLCRQICRQKTEQRKFLKMLADVAQTADVVNLVIVATIRADFLGECTDANLDKIINEQMVWLSPMNEAEFKEAIAKPAQVQGYELGEGLLDAILADIENEPNCLPLLEFALQELWTHRDQQTGKLTYDIYRNVLKGIKGTLNDHANKLYASQLKKSESRSKWMRRILLNLLRVGQDVKDTMQPAKRETLVAYGQNDDEKKEIELVLLALEGNDGRLLNAYKEQGVAMVDLAHEALIDGWEMFKEWRSQDRDLRRLGDRINDDFKQWQNQECKDKFLLPEGVVAQIEEVEGSLNDYLTDEQQQFVERSRFKYSPWLNPANLPEMVDIPSGTFWMGSPDG